MSPGGRARSGEASGEARAGVPPTPEQLFDAIAAALSIGDVLLVGELFSDGSPATGVQCTLKWRVLTVHSTPAVPSVTAPQHLHEGSTPLLVALARLTSGLADVLASAECEHR